MPGLPIERSIDNPGLLADILVSKYADHVLLYRQTAIAARDGVHLGAMRRTLPAADRGATTLYDGTGETPLHADDTSIPVLEPGKGKTVTGRL